ncbi:hypothetical protein [Pontibacter sp. H249]|uniref:hypothetical protein n=1 Tax=Pontibacter sp. H249 TaxID=3133420 RepID=UPI0030C5503A
MKTKPTVLVTIFLTIILSGFWLNAVEAQHRTAIDVQEWPNGKVVLITGDTLYGALTYHRTQDIVNVFHEDGSMSSVSPVNVEYFITQEIPSGKSSTFRSLRWNMGKSNSDFKKPTFFEELNQGALTLIMREAYVRGDGGNNGYYEATNFNNRGQLGDEVKNLYYILLPDGDIVNLRNLRKDLHMLFGSKSKEVKSYIRKNKLEYEKPHELVAIINYFNAITNSTSQTF